MMLYSTGPLYKKLLQFLWILIFTSLFTVNHTTSLSSSIPNPKIDDYLRGSPEMQPLCSAPGFKRNKTDCTKFYRCVNFNRTVDKEIYTIFRFTCGPGTVFDESLSVCTWPYLAKPSCTNEDQPTTVSTQTTHVSSSTFTPTTRPSTQISTKPSQATTHKPPSDPTDPDFLPTAGPSTTVHNNNNATTIKPPLEWTNNTTSEQCASSVSVTKPLTGTPTASEMIFSLSETNDRIKGFLVVGHTVVPNLNNQGSQSYYDSHWIGWDEYSGVLIHGSGSVITIREEGATRGSTWALPPGAIFLMKTTQGGGILTNLTYVYVSHLYLTSDSTTASLPPGTSFYIILIGSQGKVIERKALPTSTSATTVTFPSRSITSNIGFDEDGKLILIGSHSHYFRSSFKTQIISTSPTEFANYGIIYRPRSSFITSMSCFDNSLPFLSGILAIGQDTNDVPDDRLNNLLVNEADLVAIIPQDGQGQITLLQNAESSTKFQINPGSIFVILSGGSATISNLTQEYFVTTPSTTIFFPAKSSIGIFKIDLDGRLSEESLANISTGFYISTSLGSYVGILKMTQERIVTSIGNQVFKVKQLIGSQRYFGLLDLNGITFSQSESLDGIITLDYPLNGPPETVGILSNTSNGIVTSGLIQITEQDSFSNIKQSSLNLQRGTILGISTSPSQSGIVGGIVNGYLAGPAQFTFPNGITIDFFEIRMNGTILLKKRLSTTVFTSLKTPPGCILGTIHLTSEGIVKGVGNAELTTRYLHINGNSRNLAGHYGLIRFKGGLKLNQKVSGISNFNIDILKPFQIIPIYDTYSTINSVSLISNISILPDQPVAFFPEKGFSEGILSTNYSSSTFQIGPGQFLYIMGSETDKGLKFTVTNIRSGFFTTEATTISFESGNVNIYINEIGTEGEMRMVEGIGEIVEPFNIVLPAGTAFGIVRGPYYFGGNISHIGEAPLRFKTILSYDSSPFISETVVQIWDIAGYLSNQTNTQ